MILTLNMTLVFFWS